MAGLFAAGMGTEFEPDDIAALGNGCSAHYHTSRPTGPPVSTS
jgi:hypothetical protein